MAMAPDPPAGEAAYARAEGRRALSPLVGLSPEDRARHRFDEALDAAGVRADYVMETLASNTACALALSGMITHHGSRSFGARL